MVRISFHPSKYELTITGHAGAGQMGDDIVCSAVSILFYSLAATLDEHRELFTQPPSFTDEAGNGHLECKPSPKYEATVKTLFTPVLKGYQLLADAYPKFVELK